MLKSPASYEQTSKAYHTRSRQQKAQNSILKLILLFLKPKFIYFLHKHLHVAAGKTCFRVQLKHREMRESLPVCKQTAR